MLINHSIIYMLGRALPGAINIITLSVFTRLMGTEQFGNYSLILISISILNAICFQWIGFGLSRNLEVYKYKQGKLLSNVVLSYVLMLVLSMIIGSVIIVMAHDKTAKIYIIITLITTWAQGWFDLNSRLLNARLNPVKYSMLGVIKSLLILIFGYTLFSIGIGIYGIFIAIFISLLITAVYRISDWKDVDTDLYDKDIILMMYKYGTPLTIVYFLTLVVDVSDRYIIATMLDTASVGMYSAGYDLSMQTLGLIMGAVHLAAFPLAVGAMEAMGDSGVQEQLKKNGFMLLVIAFPAMVGLIMLSDNISNVLLGSKFKEVSSDIMPYISIAVFLGAYKAFYIDSIYQLKGKTIVLIYVMAVSAIFNVVLNIILIPIYGLPGAAFATVITFLVSFILSWYQGNKLLKIPLPDNICKVIVSTLAMIIVLWPISDWEGAGNLIIQIGVGSLSYITMLVFLLRREISSLIRM